MKCCCAITILLVLSWQIANAQSAHSNGNTQTLNSQTFIPLEYRHCVVERRENPVYPGPKRLTLNADSSFHYLNIVDCSCFGWSDIKGKWRIKDRILFLDRENLLKHGTPGLTTKYIFSDTLLIYYDASETNPNLNWGTFRLYIPVKSVLPCPGQQPFVVEP
jgi:hypothetical protein